MRPRGPGGKADGMRPSQFDPLQLRIGICVEREHFRARPKRRKIAMDHLVDDKNYYRKLKRISDEQHCWRHRR